MASGKPRCSIDCKGFPSQLRMSRRQRFSPRTCNGATSRHLTSSRCGSCACCIAWRAESVPDVAVLHMAQMEVWDVVDKAAKTKGGSKASMVLDARSIDVYMGAHIVVFLLDPRSVRRRVLSGGVRALLSTNAVWCRRRRLTM